MNTLTCVLLCCASYLLGGYFTLQLAAAQSLAPRSWREELIVTLAWPAVALALILGRWLSISGDDL